MLIVQNKVDSESQKANYIDKQHDIRDCYHLSVMNAYRYSIGQEAFRIFDLKFQEFKERLTDIMFQNAVEFPIVHYYLKVRVRLEELADKYDYIPFSQLNEIALEFDKTPNEELLLAYLKSFTNTVLYFPQNDTLKDRLYLNPTHISRDIYKILNKQVRENNGKFDVAHIKTRLNLNDDQEAERFVALMRAFDLIFQKCRR